MDSLERQMLIEYELVAKMVYRGSQAYTSTRTSHMCFPIPASACLMPMASRIREKTMAAMTR
jgi:hypothetical protein